MSYKINISPLPDDKILALSKLKAFADNNFSVVQMAQTFLHRIENGVGKGEKAGYQHFSFSHNVLKGFFPGGVKGGILWYRFKITGKSSLYNL